VAEQQQTVISTYLPPQQSDGRPELLVIQSTCPTDAWGAHIIRVDAMLMTVVLSSPMARAARI